MAEPVQPPALSPLYAPATEDTQIVIRFVGNTARVQGFGYKGELDPFQMSAAGWWLKRQADSMQTGAEMAEAERQRKLHIATPDGVVLPPGAGLPRG